MITVEEAKQLLFSRIRPSEPIKTLIGEAYGFILAEDIFAPIDLPIFDASSVDGYAITCPLPLTPYPFTVIGEIKAGDDAHFELKSGQAMRIFTGAMVPTSATEIVMQEQVERRGEELIFNNLYKAGNYIRKQGSQLKKGDLVMQKGSFLHPGSIGFLASMGLAEIAVYPKPKVSIIVTGNEIIKPGNSLVPGQIYESNSYALLSALQQMQINPINVLNAKDTREDLDKQLTIAIKDSDVIILTGGISVGEYDLVYNALKDAGAETLFYKVAQRPGKPLWVGNLENKWIFALPGNPASVMACYYEYVYPTIRMICGFANAELKKARMKLLKEIKDSDQRAAFIRAKIIEEGVMPEDKQDSGMMISFAGGDALIYVPKETTHMAKDEMVEVHLLPFS